MDSVDRGVDGAGVGAPTPGPWRADTYGGDWWVWSRGSDMVADHSDDMGFPEGTVARMRGVGRGASTAEQRANAHLIAAAPAMRAVLLEVEWAVLDAHDQPACCPSCWGHRWSVGHAPDCRLRAALASALPPQKESSNG